MFIWYINTINQYKSVFTEDFLYKTILYEDFCNEDFFDVTINLSSNNIDLDISRDKIKKINNIRVVDIISILTNALKNYQRSNETLNLPYLILNNLNNKLFSHEKLYIKKVENKIFAGYSNEGVQTLSKELLKYLKRTWQKPVVNDMLQIKAIKTVYKHSSQGTKNESEDFLIQISDKFLGEFFDSYHTIQDVDIASILNDNFNNIITYHHNNNLKFFNSYRNLNELCELAKKERHCLAIQVISYFKERVIQRYSNQSDDTFRVKIQMFLILLGVFLTLDDLKNDFLLYELKE